MYNIVLYYCMMYNTSVHMYVFIKPNILDSITEKLAQKNCLTEENGRNLMKSDRGGIPLFDLH